MPYKDPEKRREYRRRYYQENRESLKSKTKNWKIINKDNPSIFCLSKEYAAEKSKKHRLKKKMLLQTVKMFYGCQSPICQSKNLPACCLDFHHKDPKQKKFAVSLGQVNYAHSDVIAEINKCIIICANCHRVFHETGFDISNISTCCVDEQGTPMKKA